MPKNEAIAGPTLFDPAVIADGAPTVAMRKPAAVPGDSPPAVLSLAEPAAIDFVEARPAKEGEAPSLPRFKVLAHTFRPVKVGGWYHPVLMDIDGASIPSQTRPIRYGHDANQGVGHTDSIAITDGKLVAEGVISRDTPAAKDVVGSAKNGFPWQASIGASVDEYEYVSEKQKAVVNGKEYAGPLTVARKWTLMEISFVDLGADDRTKAKVAAKAKDAGASDPDTGDGPEDEPGGTNQVVAAAKRERERLRGIRAIVEQAVSFRGADMEEIQRIGANAEESGASVKDTELEILRATRPRAPSVRRQDAPSRQVLEASLCMACGVSDEKLAKDRDYGPDVVTQAWPLRTRGLRGTIAAALEAAGTRVPHGGREMFTAILEHGKVQMSGFSTINLPGILGNVANKLLLDAFTSIEATYTVVADQADFSNFHTHSIYRLDHLGEFAQVAPSGELEHGSLAQSAYSNKLETYGQMLTLSRQSIINDDLNAFRSLTAQLSRKARIAVEKALYTVLCEGSDVFFTAGQGNKLTGSLGITELGAAEAALMNMTDAGGDPIYAMPKLLLVPPALKFLADSIYTSAQVNETTTTNKMRPMDNPYRGRFQVVSSPYLSSSAITGSSATTWYLLADPMVLPAFQVAYLDGRRAPTVETADAEFNTLGLQMRCYWDFGVAELDYRGAIKNV